MEYALSPMAMSSYSNTSSKLDHIKDERVISRSSISGKSLSKSSVPLSSPKKLTTSTLLGASGAYKKEPVERSVKNIETSEGEYVLQRHHRISRKLLCLKTPFDPLHQVPVFCSIVKTPYNFNKLMFEVKKEKLVENSVGEENDFLLAFSSNNAMFLDRYYHQHNQSYIRNTLLSTFRTPEEREKEQRGNKPNAPWEGYNTLRISHWPHHIKFKKYPSCHLFYHATEEQSSKNRNFFLVCGLTSGEIIVYEPWKYSTNEPFTTITVSSSRVMCMEWMGGEEGRLLFAAFADGTIHIINLYSKSRNGNVTVKDFGPKDAFAVWNNPQGISSNPVQIWKFSDQSITGIARSPNNDYLAITSSDGYLRVVDLVEETKIRNLHPSNTSGSSVRPSNTSGSSVRPSNTSGLSARPGHCVSVFQSYFGGFTCVDWSPDGLFLLTGGEDDFVSLWSFLKRKLVARCQGHRSWVSSVCFDNFLCFADSYRFGSVGEDGRFLLWEYTLSDHLLHRNRSSSSILFKSKNRRARSPKKLLQPGTADTDCGIVLAPGLNDVPLLDPEANHRAHNVPCTNLFFTKQSIITVGNEPCVRVWARPSMYVPNPEKPVVEPTQVETTKSPEVANSTVTNTEKEDNAAMIDTKKEEETLPAIPEPEDIGKLLP